MMDKTAYIFPAIYRIANRGKLDKKSSTVDETTVHITSMLSGSQRL